MTIYVRLPGMRGKQGTPTYGLRQVDQEFRIDTGPVNLRGMTGKQAFGPS